MQVGAVTAASDCDILNELNHTMKHMQNMATFHKFCNDEVYYIVNDNSWFAHG